MITFTGTADPRLGNLPPPGSRSDDEAIPGRVGTKLVANDDPQRLQEKPTRPRAATIATYCDIADL